MVISAILKPFSVLYVRRRRMQRILAIVQDITAVSKLTKLPDCECDQMTTLPFGNYSVSSFGYSTCMISRCTTFELCSFFTHFREKKMTVRF